jgi:hypothetical protein
MTVLREVMLKKMEIYLKYIYTCENENLSLDKAIKNLVGIMKREYYKEDETPLEGLKYFLNNLKKLKNIKEPIKLEKLMDEVFLGKYDLCKYNVVKYAQHSFINSCRNKYYELSNKNMNKYDLMNKFIEKIMEKHQLTKNDIYNKERKFKEEVLDKCENILPDPEFVKEKLERKRKFFDKQIF